MSLGYFNQDDDDYTKIHSERLLSVLTTKFNGLLGKVLTEAMINSLKYHGVDITNKNKFYSLMDIQEALNKIVGEKASKLLIERLKKELSAS